LDREASANLIIDAADECNLGISVGEVSDGVEGCLPLLSGLRAKADRHGHGLAARLKGLPGLRVQAQHSIHLAYPAHALVQLRCHLIVADKAEGLSDVLKTDRCIDGGKGISVEVGQVCLEKGSVLIGGLNETGKLHDSGLLSCPPPPLAVGNGVTSSVVGWADPEWRENTDIRKAGCQFAQGVLVELLTRLKRIRLKVLSLDPEEVSPLSQLRGARRSGTEGQSLACGASHATPAIAGAKLIT
jgi:hypothetical protein